MRGKKSKKYSHHWVEIKNLVRPTLSNPELFETAREWLDGYTESKHIIIYSMIKRAIEEKFNLVVFRYDSYNKLLKELIIEREQILEEWKKL